MDASYPRRGAPGLAALARLGFRLSGWHLAGALPEIDKFVIIFAPHTSSADFFVTVGASLAFDVDAHWMAKKSIFVEPVATLFRAIGGIAVDRENPRTLVDDLVNEFRRRDKMVLGLAPEGTRGKVERWRTGFYRIAEAAGVPVVLAYIDKRNKTLGVGPIFELSGDRDRDIAEMRAFYARFAK